MSLVGAGVDIDDGEGDWTMLDALLSASEHEKAVMEACLLAERHGDDADADELARHLAAAEEELEDALEDVRLAREAAKARVTAADGGNA